MTVSITSSLPRVRYRGIKDEGAGTPVLAAEQLPIRLPLFFSLAPWGDPQQAIYSDAATITKLNGVDVITPGSKFYTHQSVFINTQFEGAGACLFNRLQPDDAEEATIRFSVDMVKRKVPVYKRGDDGKLLLDANGAKQATGATVDGVALKWVLTQVTKDKNGETTFGVASQSTGALLDDAGGNSTLYPVFDAKLRFAGSRGNNIGLRFIAPTVDSAEPADADLQSALGSFLYRFQAIERSATNATPQVISTLQSEQYIDFSFKEGVVDLDLGTEYFIEDILLESYESTDPESFTGYGPFSSIHVYQGNLTKVLEACAEAEGVASGEEVADPYLLNALTGSDVYGVPYHGIEVLSVADGGLLFTANSNHYGQGGSDGDLSAENFDLLVAEMLENFGEGLVPFADIARYPFDSVWDTGFSVSTKKLFANVLGVRPDVHVHVCTQDVSESLNSPAKESAVAALLRAHFRNYAESSEFGTKTVRVTLMGNAGKLIGSKYRKLVPFLEGLCFKGAQYMGAGNGYMNPRYSFSRAPGNVIGRYKEHNAVFKAEDARNADWKNGLNFAQSFDMKQLFWAGLQSIYEDHTSPLHSYVNVCIACNATRIGHIVWRRFSGDDQLDDGQFLQAVNEEVELLTAGRYDNRVDITPNAYFTAQDEALGFPWHLDIILGGQNIRTVETLAVIMQRRRQQETN